MSQSSVSTLTGVGQVTAHIVTVALAVLAEKVLAYVRP